MTEAASTAATSSERPGPGMRAVAVRRPGRGRAGRTRRLVGVLLPPAEKGGAVRLHLDEPPLRVVVELGPPQEWDLVHEKGLAERRRDRHRRLCPDGRPIYLHDELPAAQLATRTMLRNQRRRPAEGQQPIASYMMHGGYAPLYAVADTVELPPLPPARQAAYVEARTCARCEATSHRRLPRLADGRRYCAGCEEPASAALWYRQRAEGRRAAQAWAADVLADARRDLGQVAVVYVGYPTSVMSQTVVAETWDGEVLVAARVCDDDVFFRDGDTRPADLAAAFARLAGRRLICWRGTQRWLAALQDLMRPHVDIPALSLEGGDAGVHWDQWCAERPHGRDVPFPFRYEESVQLQAPPAWRPPELLAHVRHVVTEMATRPCYWWWATCQDPDCGQRWPFGTSAASVRWSDRHYADTGHVISHTCSDGTTVPTDL